MTWLYNETPVDHIDTQKFVAFVYKITNLINGKFYIGYKQTIFAKTRQVKGKKKRIKVESDWCDYWSSSEELKADVERLGVENFKREILHFCLSKSMASYLELREQVDQRVIENPETNYNRMINARVSYNHIKGVLKDIHELPSIKYPVEREQQ